MCTREKLFSWEMTFAKEKVARGPTIHSLERNKEKIVKSVHGMEERKCVQGGEEAREKTLHLHSSGKRTDPFPIRNES